MHRDLLVSRPAPSRGRIRRGRAALALAAVSWLSGCYVHAPVTGAPRPGTTVVLDLNDRGRAALGDSIGPSAEQIQGAVATSSDSSYVLRVESVRYISGQTNRWSGEPLLVRADLVGRMRERQFSRKRTLVLGLGAAAAILAVALSTDLFGSGELGRVIDPPPPLGQ